MDNSEENEDDKISSFEGSECSNIDLNKLENFGNELKKMLPGLHEKLPDSDEIPPLPHWVNIEKVKKGQQFGLKYLYGLNYSQTLSLLYLFAAPEGLKPLIFTEKSHTPCLAHKRYLSTALRVKSWYETEFWKSSTTGYKNLKAVKSLHLNVSKRLSQLSVDEIERKCNLEEKLRDSGVGMLVDFQTKCVNVSPDVNLDDVNTTMKSTECKPQHLYLNQMEMSMTQFGFFGLMLIYPEKFAARNATEDELECFVHMWRLLGYLLGIKDEYNFCMGDLSTVKLRSQQFIECMVKPMILRVQGNKNWEHMIRCAFQGIEKFTKLRIQFESTLLYFCWILNIPTSALFRSIGWTELIRFHLAKFFMTKAPLIPGFTKFFNSRITKIIERAQIDFEKSKKEY